MDAEITIKFVIKDICSQKYLDMTEVSLDYMTKYIIKEEGIRGLIEDYEIVNIEEIKDG